MKFKRDILPIIWVILSFCAIGFAGNEEYIRIEQELEFYCKMVSAGFWPAYQNNINCEENNDDEND